MTAPTWLDAAGRRRSPATMPGFHRGRPPCNKGRRYPAEPPSMEEIVTVMRVAGERPHGLRTRALVVLLWRAGLRISEALAVAESDLDRERGGVLVRHGKGGKRREVGMDHWAWERSRRGSRLASHCLSARLCASSTVRRAGDPGQQQPPERPFALSPSTLALGVASLHISYDMPTPSRWPARASRSTSYNGSSAMRTSGSPRSTCKASTTARSSTRCTADRPRYCRQAPDFASAPRASRQRGSSAIAVWQGRRGTLRRWRPARVS